LKPLILIAQAKVGKPKFNICDGGSGEAKGCGLMGE
jgi:hypothetical protein